MLSNLTCTRVPLGFILLFCVSGQSWRDISLSVSLARNLSQFKEYLTQPTQDYHDYHDDHHDDHNDHHDHHDSEVLRQGACHNSKNTWRNLLRANYTLPLWILPDLLIKVLPPILIYCNLLFQNLSRLCVAIWNQFRREINWELKRKLCDK